MLMRVSTWYIEWSHKLVGVVIKQLGEPLVMDNAVLLQHRYDGFFDNLEGSVIFVAFVEHFFELFDCHLLVVIDIFSKEHKFDRVEPPAV